jgi:hypothetical protein
MDLAGQEEFGGPVATGWPSRSIRRPASDAASAHAKIPCRAWRRGISLVFQCDLELLVRRDGGATLQEVAFSWPEISRLLGADR